VRDHLALVQRGFIRADQELVKTRRALTTGALDDDAGIEAEEERGRVGVGLGKAEVAGEGAGSADTGVGDAALDIGEGREPLVMERTE